MVGSFIESHATPENPSDENRSGSIQAGLRGYEGGIKNDNGKNGGNDGARVSDLKKRQAR